MLTYENSCNLGEIGEKYVIEFTKWLNPKSEAIRITSKDDQKNYGDFYWSFGGCTYSVDVKTEESDKYGNFFFEYWSNRKYKTLGWGPISKMSILAYLFIEDNKLYLINFQNFKIWAYEQENIFDFTLKPQWKYSQLNDSWGYCVPISYCKKVPELELIEFDTERFYNEIYSEKL